MAKVNAPDFTQNRQALMAAIGSEAHLIARWTGRSVFDPAVLAAIDATPRERFVTDQDQPNAYANRPLSIGWGQTISQPFIVAAMTELLDLENADTVLEIGTGCGYQTAVLSALVTRVFTVEVIAELSAGAQTRLTALDIGNVRYRVGDGRLGWPEAAPFPRILVTAAAPGIPETLVNQLAPGGQMIIPIGDTGGPQNLVRVAKSSDRRVSRENLLPVAFVPLV